MRRPARAAAAVLVSDSAEVSRDLAVEVAVGADDGFLHEGIDVAIGDRLCTLGDRAE